MIGGSVPSAEQQLGFLQQLQRLFGEGDFSSTYKYALLLAFAELSIELGDDSGAELHLPLSRIAEKFAEFYWPQTLPYRPSNVGGDILLQNYGRQAAVIGHLLTLRANGVTTLVQARRHPGWPIAIRAISKVVRDMPVQYLQNLTGARIVFLYDPVIVNGILRLLPGVAFHFRQFQSFVQQLVRAGWIEHVRGNSQNATLIGPATDLETFMFGTARSDLSQVAPILSAIQRQRCFFCGERLGNAPAVDHFIPWSRYPRDTALNFVLAHRACNQDKREFLASRIHLERWLERNDSQAEIILDELQTLGFVPEREVTKMVARWAYQQAVQHCSQSWVERGRTEPITASYLELFG